MQLQYAVSEIFYYTREDLNDALELRNSAHYFNMFTFNEGEESRLVIVIGFCQFFELSEFNENTQWDFEAVSEIPLYHDYDNKYEHYTECTCRVEWRLPDSIEVEIIDDMLKLQEEPDEEMQAHFDEVEYLGSISEDFDTSEEWDSSSEDWSTETKPDD